MKFAGNHFALVLILAISFTRGAYAEIDSHSEGGTSSKHPIKEETKVLAPDREEEFVPNPLKVSLTEEQREVFRQTNQWRRKHVDSNTGKPLEMVAPAQVLMNASCNHSNSMASQNFFSHATSLAGNGYRSENIAAGNWDPTATMNQWKTSPGHNTNMLGAQYRYMGVCRAYSANSLYKSYWTQNFSSGPEVAAQKAK